MIIPNHVVRILFNNSHLSRKGVFKIFLFAATAMVVPCIMTMASEHGKESQKGTVMGIFRSLGALARALGPIFASIAFWSVGSKVTYLCGAVGLLWPVLSLMKKL